MLVNVLSASALLAAAATVVTAVETHGGVDFEVRFAANATPVATPIKTAYESAAASQAAARLHEAIENTGITADCLEAHNGTSVDELYALKNCIDAEDEGAFFTLLESDIERANAFWATVVAESTADRTQWVPARVWVKAYFGASLTATEFAAWTASDNADAANLDANPEHYYKKTELTGLTSQASKIFEGWGGVLSDFGMVRTNFSVPDYSTPDFGTADYPASWNPGSEFSLLYQRIGAKILTSGTQDTFGVLHIAVREFLAAGGDEGVPGLEIYAAVWYPPWDGAADAANTTEFQTNYLRDEAEHMVVEIVNLSLQAREDCETSLCVL
ncbi:hypothetical protein GGR56DRAFT_668753 [Xylariaceae sp. FL0804]|nr:hypothetical protein GGR56DRAFT_668753 [Xylariaceae sp. FL0804]